MRSLIQRVAWAEVEVEGETVGRISHGLLVYVGVGSADTRADADWLAEKIANLRIFEGHNGKMNISVQDARGGVLVVSNFTLQADAQKGRRPSFDGAAQATQAEPLTEALVQALRSQGCEVETGRFGAKMFVRAEAAGPVNVVVDSPGKL